MAIKAQLHDGTVLEFPDGTSPDVIQSVVKKQLVVETASNSQSDNTPEERPKDDSNPVINALYGFAAKGNQAMNALNPFADAEDSQRIAAEQEWVKQHKGAEAGSVLADMAITAPAGAGSGAAIRSLASGAIEGLTHSGNLEDKLKEMGLSTLGAGIGEGAANVLGFMARPFTKSGGAIDDVTEALRQKAKDIGIKLNAAQETGNKTLQAVDKQLSVLPSSSEFQAGQKEAQRLTWQKALFGQGGEDANMATPDVMAAMKARIGGNYNDIAARNDLVVDPTFKAELANVEQSLMGRIPTNQKGIVKSYLKDFNTAPEGALISGKQYQDIRSMLDKQAKSFANVDPATSDALRSIRTSADGAMARSVSPDDLAALNKANNDWSVMKSIEKAVDPETSTIKPNILLNGLKQRDPNRVIYGAGDQSLNDLAKVGKAFIPDKAPDSGTAINSAIVKALTGGGIFSGMAGADYAMNRDPAQAAGVGATSLAASILGPKAAARALWKENGYLSKGLADLSKEALPGLSRQRLIAELMRNAGTQEAN
ncbi:MAG: hypothetical protein ACXWAT_00620 [Methylobacter sp.]